MVHSQHVYGWFRGSPQQRDVAIEGGGLSSDSHVGNAFPEFSLDFRSDGAKVERREAGTPRRLVKGESEEEATHLLQGTAAAEKVTSGGR